MRLHVVHDVGEALLVRRLGLALLLESGLQWSRIVRGISVRHHHNHGLCLAQGNEVVHNLCRTAQCEPSLLVASCAVQQVEHGICLALVIAWGRVDAHAALHAERGAVVPDVCHVAVLHVVVLVEIAAVALLLADDEDAHEGAHVAAPLDVACVLHLCAVHIEAVVVKLGGEDSGGVGPYTVLLCQVSVSVFDAIAYDGDFLCIGSLDAQGDGAVVVELWGTSVASLKNGLLCLCGKSHEQQCCKKIQSFHLTFTFFNCLSFTICLLF